VTHRTSRFAGFAAAFVAGTLASSPTGLAQAGSSHGPGNGSRSGSEPGTGLTAGLGAGVFGTALHAGVSGIVRDRTGRPQIGALVELLNADYAIVARTFTDDRGRYTLARLGAGVYQVKASDSDFLPTVRPDLRLLTNTRVVVNLTLSTLYQVLQWLPAEPRTAGSVPDDWDWTLRLSTNRPLLRMLQTASVPNRDRDTVGEDEAEKQADGTGPVVIQTGNPEQPGGGSHTLQLAIHSGFSSFGEGGLAQQLAWSGGDNGAGAVLLAVQSALNADGSLGRLSTSAAWREQLSPDRTMVTIATLSDRPDIASAGEAGLITMRVRSASTVAFGDLGEISAGTELAGARLGNGSMTIGAHPFVTVLAHTGQSTVAYKVATAPTMLAGDRMEAESQEDAPALSEANGALRMEAGLHQELAISRPLGGHPGSLLGSWTGELSVFHDAMANPVVQGLVSGDEAAVDTSNVLYDPGTGTIAVSGHGYSGGGVLAMLHDQLSPDTWLSFRYAMGEAETMQAFGAMAQALPSFETERSSMLAAAAETRLPMTGTIVRGSYRWQPVSTLTAIAPFAGGLPDAYLSLYLRQPLHLERVGAGNQVEAILDVRNLLAQGYRPFLSQDGTTVYFAQAQRCIAAGVSFSF
jgi:hypothetical protein